MQIATSISDTLSISFPISFAEFLGLFNFVNINPFQVVAFECIGGYNYYDRKLALPGSLCKSSCIISITYRLLPLIAPTELLCMTLIPIGISSLMLGLYKRQDLLGKQSSAFTWLLIFLFFIMPPVSSTIFNVYKCRYFEDSDEWWLVADYSIKCSGATRQYWLVYAAIMKCSLKDLGVYVVCLIHFQVAQIF